MSDVAVTIPPGELSGAVSNTPPKMQAKQDKAPDKGEEE